MFMDKDILTLKVQIQQVSYKYIQANNEQIQITIKMTERELS